MTKIVAWESDDGRIFKDYQAYRKHANSLAYRARRDRQDEMKLSCAIRKIESLCSEAKDPVQLSKLITENWILFQTVERLSRWKADRRKKLINLEHLCVDVLWSNNLERWDGEIRFTLSSSPCTFGSRFFSGTPILTGTGGGSSKTFGSEEMKYAFHISLDPKYFKTMYQRHLKAQTSNVIFETDYDYMD